MRYSYNWLKELSGTKLTSEKLADLLTRRSFEVEEIKKTGEDLERVVVGEILEIKKHPNADKLQMAKVDTGGKKINIVCGASNIEVGQKVPVALVGAKLPAGLEIKETEIRGIKSQGMLCAEDELGLGKDHNGILILDKKRKAGTGLAKALKSEDTILDLDILSNRGHDALSHMGIAREICALENRNCELLRMNKQADKSVNGNLIDIEVEDGKLCPRYIGAVIKDIKIKESPDWIKSRLMTCGISPINNVVDATNYVMLEVGQPMHAFDFNKTKKIVVRRAKEDEKIKLLDESVAELSADDLVIANENKALAVAGVMGGLESGITSKTKDIFLEAANFNAVSVRKTRMRLGINTESVYRFEREIDPNLAEKAMARAIEIISETAGGETVFLKDVYPSKVLPWKIKLDLDYADRLLGEKIPTNKIVGILESLGLKIKLSLKKGEKVATVEVPTFRIDLRTQEDLIEEVGRIYGYEKIKPQAPIIPIEPAEINESRIFERKVKDILAGSGFSEIYNYSFYSYKDTEAADLAEAKHLELENPMNPEQALMRRSLIPNLLKSIENNLKNHKELNLFEIGRVYIPGGEVLPEEKKMLVGAIVLEKDKGADSFYVTKGYVDNLLSRLEITDQYYDNFEAVSKENFNLLWHKTRSAEIKSERGGENLGRMGEISPTILTSFNIRKRVAMFEFDLEKLGEISDSEREYAPISKYPEVTRDVSMLAGEEIRVAEVLSEIQAAGGDLIVDVDLFDIFENSQDNMKSLAFHIVFGSDERTLENKEIDRLMNKIVASLEENLKVRIRK